MIWYVIPSFNTLVANRFVTKVKFVIRIFKILRGCEPNFFLNISSAVTFNYYCNVYKSIHFWNGNELENTFLISILLNFFTKKCFLPFSQKITIFGKIWYQKWILWLISIPEMYTFINIIVIIRKLQLVIFFTISGFTIPLRYGQVIWNFKFSF